MSAIQLQGESENKKTGWLISIIFHLLLLLLLFPDFFYLEKPISGQTGVLISFGTVEVGGSETQIEEAVSEETETDSESPEPENDIEDEEIESAPSVSEPSAPVAIDERRLQEERARSEAERKRAEAEAKKREEERRKAEEEARKQREFEERKKKFGDVLSSGSGGGDRSGTQGDPTGDPDRKALEEISKGSGRIGGGLSNRGVTFEPEFSDSSQKSGTVVIEICVDAAGKVTSARFTQRGSTTTDKTLIDIATAGARKYQFTFSEIEKQCGTVTVNFIVR